MKKDNRAYMEHILRAIDAIERYVHGDKSLFLSDDLRFNAVLRQLQLMAESTTHLSDQAKQSASHIPWRQIAGFRNVLVHDYLGDLDLEKIWQVIEGRLPGLKIAIQQMLRGEKT